MDAGLAAPGRRSRPGGLRQAWLDWSDRYGQVITLGVTGLCIALSWWPVARATLGLDPALVGAVIGGYPIVRAATLGAIRHRDITAGVLVSLALIAALAIGEYFAAAEVAFIMLIGEWLENRTVARASRAITSLVSLAPTTARLRTPTGEVEVQASTLVPGDVVLVKGGETIPVDGVVRAGEGTVNQTALTGESLPVEKIRDDQVLVGTILETGYLEIEAIRTGEDTTLSRVVRLVREAEANRAPIQRISDRWASWLVPASLAFAALVFLVTRDIVRAVTILIVFCPCALVLATPTAVVAGIGNAARRGILVKGGAALEVAGRVDTVAFDKTGTLTYGRLKVVAVSPLAAGVTAAEVVGHAAAAEKFSEHPLARAIVDGATAVGVAVPDPDEFRSTTGAGVHARLRGTDIAVGQARFLSGLGIRITEESDRMLAEHYAAGHTAVLVAVAGEVTGIIALADQVRREARGGVTALRREGIGRLVMVTGDHEAAAGAIGTECGFDEIYAGMLPQDKAGLIARLKAEGHTVAMVGDGINDAPSLAAADLGIAMGVAGTDIAVEAADVALMSDDIGKIPQVFELGRRVLRLIKQNLVLSSVINLVAVVAAALGVMGPVAGALVHNAGSVLVVANASRLINYHPRLVFGGGAAKRLPRQCGR